MNWGKSGLLRPNFILCIGQKPVHHKRYAMRITLSLVLACFVASLFGQAITSRFTARDRGWVTFGIDGGWAYQSSDVRTTFNGWGAGLTLGKNIFYRPGGLLSFDMRGRLLFTRSYGSDYRISSNIRDNNGLNGMKYSDINYVRDLSSPFDSSFVFANHRTGMGELDLEGVITFNRLRERTGIVLNLFGGLGFNVYRARTDQANGNGAYNYLSIDRNNGKANILAQLDNLRDGSYESRADGSLNSGLRAGFMPDAGVELGYQLGRNFVFGVGHKITFSRTDVLDGQRFNDQGLAPNDWAHYTNLFMRWDIGRRNDRQRKPEVEITEPNNDPFITDNNTVFVRATVRNVNSAADVQFFVNGESRNFEFRNGRLGANTRLRDGRNEIRVEAHTMAGSDEDQVVVIWQDRNNRGPVPPPPPPPSNAEPRVRITTPATSPSRTDRTDAYVRAEVQNVRNQRDIRVLVNGSEERFTLAEGVEANVRLREGRNVVRVEANTPAGRASDEVIIEVDRNTPPPPPPSSGRKPNVNITQPTAKTASTGEKTYDLRATVLNVSNKSDIKVLQNNRELSNFDYNSRNGEVSVRLDLLPDDNTITVKAVNSAGEAQDQVTITRRGGIVVPPQAGRKPTVTIASPRNNDKLDRRDTNFKANTTNVETRNQVVVVFNGTTLSSYDFDSKDQTVSGNLSLKDGDNTLTVKVTTSAGTDEETVRFRYEVAVAKPEVSIVAPTDGSEVRVGETELRATVKNVENKSDIRVYANGKILNRFDFNSRSGQVSAKVDLDMGENTLRISATNASGSDEASVRIKYAPAAVKPTVDIETPANGAELRTPDTELRAKVQHVTGKNEILVYLNGRTVPTFDYNTSTGVLTAKIKLGEGENTIRVSASNSGGTAEQTHKVRYKLQRTPTVRITAPADRSRTDNPQTTLRATTTNVFSDKNVTVQLNGSTVGGVTLDRSGNLSAPLTLREGSNTIAVSVSTPDGSDKAEVSVAYAPKPAPATEKPTITFTQPGARKSPVTRASYQMKAKVTGVTGNENIKLFLNGTAVKRFDYGTRTQELSANLTLKQGKNVFKIVAENAAGSTTAEAEVEYNGKPTAPKPEVEIISASQPTTDPFNPNKSKTSVLAKTKNVTEKSQITVTVNGSEISAFDFDAATNEIRFVANLIKGENPIVVKVTTPGGEDSDTRKVPF
jgi:large repetitive protein